MPTFPCPNPTTLEVRIPGGEIHLAAEPRDTAAVEVTPYDDSAASREAAEQITVEFHGDRLAIYSPEPVGRVLRWRVPQVRVTAHVPAGSDASLNVAAADTTCRGDWGSVVLNAASGHTVLDRLNGDLTVHCATGGVKVEEVGGRFTANAAAGDLTARRVGGPIEIKTASGNVSVDRADADVEIKTASGDVRVGATRQGRVRTNTVSGDVSVGVLAGTAVWLDLNSLTGDTRSDLAMGSDVEAHAVTEHSLTIQARAVSGSINVHRVTPAESTTTPRD